MQSCEILHQISFNLELKIVYFNKYWSLASLFLLPQRSVSVHVVVSLAGVIIYKVGSQIFIFFNCPLQLLLQSGIGY